MISKKQDHVLGISLHTNAKLSCSENSYVDLKKLHLWACGTSRISLNGVIPKQRLILENDAQYDAVNVRSNNIEILCENGSVAHVFLEEKQKKSQLITPSLKYELFEYSRMTYRGNPIIAESSSITGEACVEQIK